MESEGKRGKPARAGLVALCLLSLHKSSTNVPSPGLGWAKTAAGGPTPSRRGVFGSQPQAARWLTRPHRWELCPLAPPPPFQHLLAEAPGFGSLRMPSVILAQFYLD